MKQGSFFEVLAAQRYHVVDNAAYGVLDAYPFAVRRPQNNKYVTVSITVQTAPDKAQAKALRAALKQQGIKANWNGRVLSYSFRTDRSATPELLREGLAAAIQTLRQAGLMPPCTCGICAQGGTDAFILRNIPPQGYDAVHARCVDQMQDSAHAQVRKNPGSYLTGIVGALLGAFVGGLPAFIALHFLHIVSAWLFMLLPIASYFGYKLCRGKMNAVAGISAVVCSLLGLGLVILAWDTAVNMSDLGLDFSDAVRFTWYFTFTEFSAEYWEWIKPNIASIVLFYLLGVFFSFGIVSRTNKTELKSIEQMRATMLVRVDPSAPQAAPEAPSEPEPHQPEPQPEQVPWEF